MLARTARRFAGFVFGGTCYLCRGAVAATRRAGVTGTGLLCADCEADLPRLGAALCPRCALPSPEAALCGRCLADPPAFDATFAALVYGFPADVLVQALKFRGELALAPLLGEWLACAIPAGARADVVVPVPLSARRLRERGYNQALEVARTLAAARELPLEHGLCTRRRDTPAQSELPWAERARNVRGAFVCHPGVEGRVVAVVDDVMTTGATLGELARTLKRAGAAGVVNWVVARTLPPADGAAGAALDAPG